jgi:hypothetical protein
LVDTQGRKLKGNTPIAFTNLESCTQYNLKAELKWKDTQIIDCEGNALPPLGNTSFFTHPKKSPKLQLEEIETGTDFIRVNFTGAFIHYIDVTVGV